MPVQRLPALPGTGFRVWLAALSGASLLFGAAFEFDGWMATWFFIPPFGGFLICNLVPIGLALWVACRHAWHRRLKSAAIYGSLPIVAVVLAAGCIWVGVKGVVEARLWHYGNQVRAAQRTGTAVRTSEAWIEPGPPARADFITDGSIFGRNHMIYAADGDHEWLDRQARECRSHPVPLGRNFYALYGSC